MRESAMVEQFGCNQGDVRRDEASNKDDHGDPEC
jgi:hypothetical protein